MLRGFLISYLLRKVDNIKDEDRVAVVIVHIDLNNRDDAVYVKNIENYIKTLKISIVF